jgi:hypothetical protein
MSYQASHLHLTLGIARDNTIHLARLLDLSISRTQAAEKSKC